MLAVLYSIGLGISGVNNFILISCIAAFLSLLPYIGNIIGFFLALIFGFLTTGDTTVLIGIIITFGIVQFVESYILEPYVVGDKVNVHPFLVILAVIAGNMIWGITGMILAIPILGILNVIMNSVPSLEPFGYLLSTDDNEEEN
ncbi:AI-2E family transporter [Antarcticibacterium sp. 1MA-6-2]|uniref:AI-2E family transporter n=1 Tax=Antarcticibacterium sp. 1MA-6-2 TaxID=2908210 RepID=UPI002107027E|nr:AI-2E family transporter [Antarcticibacterium sp. 1MA-6-2]